VYTIPDADIFWRRKGEEVGKKENNKRNSITTNALQVIVIP
jgi:hypothetical protein